MFTHQKKDYYSVNANISLSPITEQQHLQQMLQKEQNQTVSVMNNLQEQSMQMSQNEEENQSQSIQQQQQNVAQESNNRMYAIAEHLQNPISTRYDDIYHPRTDKRVIKGNQYTYSGNEYKQNIAQGNSVEECITKIIQNESEGRCPIEFTNILSRAKVIEMKGIRPQEKCRSFNGLYQDSQCLSAYHERQKFGLRSGEGEEGTSKTVQKATFQNGSQDQNAVPAQE